jgi:Cytochrome P450
MQQDFERQVDVLSAQRLDLRGAWRGPHPGRHAGHRQHRRRQPRPAVYPDPDRLDITREAPPAMLTFGGGVHYCLGSHLARLELAEALTVITRRMPHPRRTGPAPWKPLTGMSGPTTLPIEFDPGH